MRSDKKIIAIEVTQHCGNACPYCFVRANTDAEQELSLHEVETLCLQAVRSGFNHVHLTGGDILGWKGLKYVVCALVSSGIPVSLNLTAETLTEEWCSWIRDMSGGISATLTLNGSSEDHDRMRGAGSYRSTVKGIELILKNNIPLVLFTVLGSSRVKNAGEIAEEIFSIFPDIDINAFICLSDPVPSHEFHRDIIDARNFIDLSKTVTVLAMLGYPVTVHGRFHGLHRLVEREFTQTEIRPVSYSGYGSELFISANRQISLSHAGPFYWFDSLPGNFDKVLRDLQKSDIICAACEFNYLCMSNNARFPVYVKNRLFCHEVIRLGLNEISGSDQTFAEVCSKL